MLATPKAPTSVSYLPDLVGWGLFTQGCKLKKIGNFNLSWYSEKYIWLHNYLFYNLQCYWQVLQTSTDPDQQFSAPFKARNSRQVQTCYKSMVQTQRKLQHFLVCTGTGEMGVLMTLKHWASTQQHLQLCARKRFHSWCWLSCSIFVATEWNTAVITMSQFKQESEVVKLTS